MLLSMYRRKKRFEKGVVPFVIISALLVALTCHQSYAAKPKQETFVSPQEAVKAMVDAMKAADIGKLLAIFGPASKELFSSGDDATDRRIREEFVKAYEEKNRFEAVGKKKVILHVGNDDWPWPIPVVNAGHRWRFDAKAGRQEALARRIGEDELAAIQVCLAYVDAQREYAQDHRTGGIMEYAQKLVSEPGKTDGLCWEEKEGGKQSPLGPLVGSACRIQARNKAVSRNPIMAIFTKYLKSKASMPPEEHTIML